MSKITVLRVTKTEQSGKYGPYPVVDLAYKTEDDKTKGMKIFGFGPQKEVAAVAGSAQQGDVLEAVFHQNAKGFWEFTSLKNTGEKQATDSPKVGLGAAVGVSRGNWETPEERQARQVMIVRQSSLSTAVAYTEAQKVKTDFAGIIQIAKNFEAYVLGTNQQQQPTVTGDVQ